MSEQRKESRFDRYRRWKAGLDATGRRRWRIIRIAAAVGIALAVLLVAYSAVVRRPDIPSLSVDADVSVGANQTGVGERRAGVYTLLVVGKDTGGGGNTDTMILATYDTKAKTLNAISLPRDTMTNVSWSNKKLNTVYNYYKGKDKETQVEKGMTALKTHVAKLTGIFPDFYVMVDWDAVGELVDAIGGVTFDVPYDMHYDDPYQDLHIHQDKGVRKLTGEDAMQVIRWRKNNGQYGKLQIGDSGRMKIQQDFLMATAKECLQLKHLMNASEFARIFTENVTTDLTVGNLVWLAQQAIGMDAEQDIHFHTMPFTNYTRGTAYVLPVVDELLTLLNGGLNPYKDEITVDELEVLQLNKDGSLSLTSGTLEDSSLGKAKKPQPAAKPAEPEQSVQPELQPETQPEQTVEGEQPQEPVPEQPETPDQSEQHEQAEQPGQPDRSETEPEVQPEEAPKPSDNEMNQTSGEVQEELPVLPAHPVPVE